MPRALPDDPPGDAPRHGLHDGPKPRAASPNPALPTDLGPTPLCTPFPLGSSGDLPPAPPALTRHPSGPAGTPPPKRR